METLSRRGLLAIGPAAAGGGIAALAAGPAAAANGPGIALGSLKPDSCFDLLGDGSDTTALWKEALARVGAAGGGCVRVFGEHKISDRLDLPDCFYLEIAGFGAVVRKGRPGEEFRLFQGRPSLSTATVVFRDLLMIGDWDEVPTMGGNDSRCIALRGYGQAIFDHLHVRAFRQMSLTSGNTGQVLVTNCTIERSARDAINVSGSRFATISSCTVRNCGDDGIAHHAPKGMTEPERKYGTVIVGNQLEDTTGITVLGGENIIIAHNNLMRTKGSGIHIGKSTSFSEGFIEHRNVIIQGNIISDTIQMNYVRENQELDAGIIITDAGRNTYDTMIIDNIISKSKPGGVQYSDWGYGQLFTARGWMNPRLDRGHLDKGRGVFVSSLNANDTEQIFIDRNRFSRIDPTKTIVRNAG